MSTICSAGLTQCKSVTDGQTDGIRERVIEIPTLTHNRIISVNRPEDVLRCRNSRRGTGRDVADRNFMQAIRMEG